MKVHIIAGILIIAGLGIALGLLASGLTGHTEGSASAAGDVEATITVPKTTFVQGESIEVTFRLTNVGLDTATVVKPVITPNLVFFSVVGPDAQERLFLGPWGKLAPFPEELFSELSPGAYTEEAFDVEPLYSFTQLGSYDITGVYRNSDDGSRFGFSAVTTDGLESNTVTIDITS